MTQFTIQSRWISSAKRVTAAAAIALWLAPNALCADTSEAEEPVGEPNPQVSTFTLPNTLLEGRDPFHPTSARVIAATRPVVVEKKVPGPVKLELKGISGTADRPLALINNRTFAEGDEQHVSTPQGKVKVMCLSIKGEKVRVESQGQTRELMLRKGI